MVIEDLVHFERLQIRVEACNKRGVCLEEEGFSPILVPFSGGVDSTLIAALLHGCLPPGVPVELCNVSFQGEEAADRKSELLCISCTDLLTP